MNEVLTYLLNDKSDNLKCLIRYGTESAGSDIDLLAIYDSDINSSYFRHARIDLLVLTDTELLTRIKTLEPLVLEPILYGNPIFEKDDLFIRKVRTNIVQSINDGVKQDELKRKLYDYYLFASKLLSEFEKGRQKQILIELLYNLSYSISCLEYINFIDEYECPPCFKDLKESNENLKNIVEMLKMAKNGNEIKIDKIKIAMKKHENEIIKIPITL